MVQYVLKEIMLMMMFIKEAPFNYCVHKRFNDHKKKRDNKQHGCRTYKRIVELGKEHFYVELVEHCPCECKEELLKSEGHFIREMRTVNHYIAGRQLMNN